MDSLSRRDLSALRMMVGRSPIRYHWNRPCAVPPRIFLASSHDDGCWRWVDEFDQWHFDLYHYTHTCTLYRGHFDLPHMTRRVNPGTNLVHRDTPTNSKGISVPKINHKTIKLRILSLKLRIFIDPALALCVFRITRLQQPRHVRAPRHLRRSVGQYGGQMDFSTDSDIPCSSFCLRERGRVHGVPVSQVPDQLGRIRAH